MWTCGHNIGLTMAPKRKKIEYEKKRRREDTAVENVEKCMYSGIQMDQSKPSKWVWEGEESHYSSYSLPVIVIKNMLVLAQRAGFLDPLKKLRVSNLEALVYVLVNFDHSFVKTITDVLEKYEGSLSSSTVSTIFFAAPWNSQGIFISIFIFLYFLFIGFFISLFH